MQKSTLEIIITVICVLCYFLKSILISMKIVAVQPEKKATADVDVQHLGNQAVIKIVCTRRHGHVLRVLHALEECKVNVLQSNVTTVGENSIHFVTVEVNLTYHSLQ